MRRDIRKSKAQPLPVVLVFFFFLLGVEGKGLLQSPMHVRPVCCNLKAHLFNKLGLNSFTLKDRRRNRGIIHWRNQGDAIPYTQTSIHLCGYQKACSLRQFRGTCLKWGQGSSVRERGLTEFIYDPLQIFVVPCRHPFPFSRHNLANISLRRC